MKIKKIIILVFVLLIIFNSSCKEKDLSFLYTGYVRTYLENGELEQTFEGVLVLIEGTSISSTTDKQGKFEILLPDTGVNILVISKQGYGTRKRLRHFYEFEIDAGFDPLFRDTIHNISEKSKLLLSDFSFTSIEDINGEIYLKYNTTIENYNSNLFFEIFVSTDPNVSNINYFDYDEVNRPVYNGDFVESFLYMDLSAYKGQTIYAVAYGKPPFWRHNWVLEYRDYYTKDLINPALGEPSNIASYIIPTK